MLTVYGYAQSINVRKVLWACEELGLAFERADWGGVFRSTSDAQFRALNPVGMVPVIGLSLHRCQSIPMPRPRYANVDRYLGRLLQRTGFMRYGRDGGP